MSDNMNLAMRVSTQDDASPGLRKIIAEVDKLRETVLKTAAALRGLNFDNLKTPNAGKANQPRGSSPSAAFAKEARDSTRALADRFRGLNKIGVMARREAASTAKEQAASDRAATASLRAKIAGTAKVGAMRAAAERAVADEASKADKAATTALRDKLRGIASADKLRSASDAKVAAEAKAKADADTKAEKQGINALKAKLATMARTARQRLSEERAVASEQARTAAAAERDHAASLRSKIQGQRYLFGLRRSHEREQERDRKLNRADLWRYSKSAGGHARDAVGRFTRTSAAVGTAGAAGTGALVRRSLGAEVDVDAAEIGTMQYAGLSKQAARDLRDKWAAPLAESLGITTAKLLTSYTDAVKLGIPVTGAKEFAGLATQTSEAWGVPFEAVTDILGTVNTLLTSNGSAYDGGKLKSVANTLQHLAAKQSTTPEKLISFLQRGAGASQVLGMSQEAGLAFGSASTSLGNQAGQSGRMFDYVASRLVEMPRLVRKKGDEGRQARDLVQQLGYASADQMDRQRRADPDKFMPDFMERFSKINNPKKQEQMIRFFTGREWMGEFGRMVKGNSTYQEAAKLAQEAKGLDAIGKVWDLHKLKLAFVFKQFKSGWLNILGEFGKVLSPMARQAGDYFLAWSENLRSGGLAERFKAAITGFIEGLGFNDLPDLLKGMFGEPGKGDAGSIRAWGDAARGFGAGLRDVGSTIASFFRVFTGGDTSPETIGRWTGRILALSAALVVLSPVIGVLGSLASGLLAIGLAAGAAWRIMKSMGIVGEGVKPPSPVRPVGPATGASGGLMSRIMGGLGKFFVPTAVATTTSMDKADKDKLALRLGRYATARSPVASEPAKPVEKSLTDRILGLFGRSPSPEAVAKPATPPTGKATPINDSLSLSGVRAWSDPPAKLKQAHADTKAKAQSVVPSIPAKPVAPDEAPRVPGSIALAVGDFHVRLRAILDAFLDRFDKVLTGLSVNGSTIRTNATGITSDVAETVRAMGARLQLAALGAGGSAVSGLGSSSLGGGGSFGGGGGGSLAYVSGGGARAGQRVSDFAGSFRGGHGGSSMVGYGANPSAFKPALDYIAKAEGTAGETGGGYNTSLGYGKFLPGRQEQNLTGKTLNEILALGDHMRRQPGNPNSSALGRYQIVGQTLRDQMRKLGLKGTDLFNEATQDRIGANLIRQRGANAGGLGNEWASLKGGKGSEAARIVSAIPHDASTTPGERPAETPGSGVIASAKRIADNAKSLVGVGSSQAAQALGSRMTPGQWCADFVNGALKSAGVKGVNSSIANSFLGWGKRVLGEVQAGDVLVEHRGRGEGNPGGHAGIATGTTRERNGRTELEMVSGNYAGRVARTWEDASKVMVRRATTGLDGSDLARAATPPNAESLAKAVPTPAARGIMPNAPANGAPGNGASITAPITINHHGDSAQLANQVQNRIQESRNWQAVDQDFHSA